MTGKFKTVTFWAAAGQYTVEEGAVFKKEVTHESKRFVDIGDYALKLRTAYERLDDEGYDVVNVVPLSQGTSEASIAMGGTYLGDIGFSLIRGAVVIGKRRG